MRTVNTFCILYFYVLTVSSSPVEDDVVLRFRNGLSELPAQNDSQLLENAAKDIQNITDNTQRSEVICRTCVLTVDKVLHYRRSGGTNENMSLLLKRLCKQISTWGEVACNGTTDIELNSILYIIDNRKNLTAERVCSIYFQQHRCQDPDAYPWEIPLPGPISIDQKKDSNEIGSSSSETLEIMHLTDIHYDPLYTPGSNAKCDEPLCCSSGVPDDPENAAGYWGDYHVCDTPWHSIQELSTRLQRKHRDVDYVYFTGDIASHRFWVSSRTANTKEIVDVLQMLHDTFPNKTVFPILGNHEPHPSHYYAPEALANSNVSTQWVLDLAAKEWSRWLPEEAKATITKGGYYTVLVKSGFRIIGLNSNVCFASNLWIIYNDVDPYDQLKWLVEVLSEAEKNNEKVHILSHVPPGHNWCHQQWSNQFRKIVERFAPIISAQFNGHTHNDELRIFFDSDNSKPINVAYNGGSFTTFIGLNPNYRIYSVNSNDLMIEDYDHYIYNITEANIHPKRDPIWYKLYSFKSAYGISDMKLDTLGKLVQNMDTASDNLKKYFKFFFKDSDVIPECDDECLKSLLCTITAVETTESLDCAFQYAT